MDPSVASARDAKALPDVNQGALYMTAAAICFAFMNLLVREATRAGIPPLEAAFFRNLFALICILPWLARVGLGGLKTERFGTHLVRSIFGIIAMGLWFTAVALMPMAEAVALNFTLPLFAVAGAALFLPEKVGARRWSLR